MANFELTRSDAKLIEKIVIRLKLQGGVEPIAGFPGSKKPDVKLQFPARLKSDAKDARWQLQYDTFLYEPGFIFKGGSPRRAQLHIIYLVGGPTSDAGGLWTPAKVAAEVKQLKSYFYIGGKVHDFMPVYQIDLYEHMPADDGGTASLSSWRGKSITITPSPELITFDNKTYPLKTEIVLAMEMTSKIKANDGTKVVNYFNIADSPAQKWY